jgi:hypothetical protein
MNIWMKVKKVEANKEQFSVLIEDLHNDIEGWLDVWVDKVYKDVSIEWNQYIFFLDNENDVEKRKWQDDLGVFDYAGSLAVSVLQDKGLIYQNDKGKWFRK